MGKIKIDRIVKQSNEEGYLICTYTITDSDGTKHVIDNVSHHENDTEAFIVHPVTNEEIYVNK